jgi:hypothetical protein
MDCFYCGEADANVTIPCCGNMCHTKCLIFRVANYYRCTCGEYYLPGESTAVVHSPDPADVKQLKRHMNEVKKAKSVFSKTLREVSAYFHENIQTFVDSIMNRKKLAKESLKKCESYKALLKAQRKAMATRHAFKEKYSYQALCDFIPIVALPRCARMIDLSLSADI